MPRNCAVWNWLGWLLVRDTPLLRSRKRDEESYHDAFRPGAIGRTESRRSLAAMARFCAARGVPFLVFMLPDFTQKLSARYDLYYIHDLVARWGREDGYPTRDALNAVATRPENGRAQFSDACTCSSRIGSHDMQRFEMPRCTDTKTDRPHPLRFKPAQDRPQFMSLAFRSDIQCVIDPGLYGTWRRQRDLVRGQWSVVAELVEADFLKRLPEVSGRQSARKVRQGFHCIARNVVQPGLFERRFDLVPARRIIVNPCRISRLVILEQLPEF